MGKVHILPGGHPSTAIPTQKIAASNSAQVLTTAASLTVDADGRVNDGATGRRVIGARISIETNDIRYAMNVDPVLTGGSEKGDVAAVGDDVILRTESQVRAFRFINKTSGSNGVLMVTFTVSDTTVP